MEKSIETSICYCSRILDNYGFTFIVVWQQYNRPIMQASIGPHQMKEELFILQVWHEKRGFGGTMHSLLRVKQLVSR